MVSARRSFEGSLPVAAMTRLCEALASNEGTATYALDFGRDSFDTAFLDVRVQVSLSLVCQRTLEPFTLPLAVDARLGLIRRESEEAGLPPGSEPLLVAEDGKLSLADVIEDELLLALPLIPVNPDSRLPDEVTGSTHDDASSAERDDNPFAALRELKNH
jgi:uncharacterized protein